MSDDHQGKFLVTEGEWAGWRICQRDRFEIAAGPFYETAGEDGRIITAFRAGPEHLNGGGAVHGGCLMTLSDAALFAIADPALGSSTGVTVSLTGDFVDAGRSGELIEATGEITRAAKSMIFVRGMISSNKRPILSFSGIIKII